MTRRMKTLLTLLALATVAVFTTACANKTHTHSTGVTTSSTVGYSK
jgi:ABC-type oligopeptide transport system substrate-binding subunit